MIRRGPKPEHDFTTLYNSTLRDKNISWGALGLLVYLLSHKPDWKVSATYLAKERKLGRDGIYKLLNELKQAGYAEMRQKRQGHGRMGDVDWIIHELPLPAFPEAVPPDTASPDTANPEAVSMQEKQELAPLPAFPKAVNSPLPASPDTANPDHKKNYQGRKTIVHTPKPTSVVLEGGAGETKPEPAQAAPEPTTDSKIKRKSRRSISDELDLSILPADLSPKVWSDFVKFRKYKRALVNQSVIETIAEELEVARKAGLSPDKSLSEAMTANWAGFKAEWLINRVNSANRSEGNAKYKKPVTKADFDKIDYASGSTPPEDDPDWVKGIIQRPH